MNDLHGGAAGLAGAALRVAEEAAREAGELLLAHLGRSGREEIAGRKSACRDLVTEADRASERLVVERIRAAFPEHDVEAEEETRDDRGGRHRWFLDPLDGTVNFVHRLPLFAVSIALYEGDEPLAGVVHVPRLGETFTAARGAGARLNGEPIRVSPATELAESVLATGFPYRRSELANDNLENFARFYHDVRDLRRMGSAAVDLAYTAAGRFDGFWELHLSTHDVAAGALLVREAGGVVTDAEGGGDWLRGGHIVAGGPAIHAAMLGRVTR